MKALNLFCLFGVYSSHSRFFHSFRDVNIAGEGTRDTHTLCRAFSSEAVTICFNDLGLSRLEFTQTSA